MISAAILILFVSFFVFYNTSKKVQINTSFGIEQWINQNQKYSKLIGLFLTLIAGFLFCAIFGFGAGILSFIVVLSTFACLVVLLNPLKYIKPIPVALVFLATLLIEHLLF